MKSLIVATLLAMGLQANAQGECGVYSQGFSNEVAKLSGLNERLVAEVFDTTTSAPGLSALVDKDVITPMRTHRRLELLEGAMENNSAADIVRYVDSVADSLTLLTMGTNNITLINMNSEYSRIHRVLSQALDGMEQHCLGM
jgi:hypothetical protein